MLRALIGGKKDRNKKKAKDIGEKKLISNSRAYYTNIKHEWKGR